ncbi:hypothetical protein HPB50_020033 [Hyalomma asiaticum]|uniref:Uncharacterized protein n=1 Tax=Hyalomma asiaticum TaxID=266040 RepID=A0ACB7SHK0_HYAAI|nr:hypothetical protein HPB50_020033 [Hyalomma asiaticum]
MWRRCPPTTQGFLRSFTFCDSIARSPRDVRKVPDDNLNTRTLNEHVTSSHHGPHSYVPADETRTRAMFPPTKTAALGSSQSSMASSASQNEECHDTTNVSANGSRNVEPSVGRLSRLTLKCCSDASSCLSIFDGTQPRIAQQFMAQVQGIKELAHWMSSHTLISATNRLGGSARDGHSAYGIRTQKTMLDKVPYRLAEDELTTLFRSGIDDNTRANTLSARL